MYDVLAIGDPTIDCFIRLRDAEELVNHGVRELCVRFGDKVPFEFAVEVPAVGNAANASVSCARLGLSSAFAGYTGPDDHGQQIVDAFKAQGVATDYIEAQEGKITNYHYVLWYGSERTILIRHEHFTYAMPKLPEAPKWLYLSSLGEGTEAFQHEICAYANAHPETKLLFQPGTFQMKLGTEALKDIYARADLFFCNKEEAQLILKTQESDVKKLLEGLRALGPEIVVVTDGREGSTILSDEGAWRAPMYPDPKPPLERTGAGDATASTTMAYIIKGLPPQEALLRGHINSAYVVQEIGAQKGLRTAEEIEELYAQRPEDFVATPL